MVIWSTTLKELQNPTDWAENNRWIRQGGTETMGTSVWVAIGIAIAAALGLFGKSKKKNNISRIIFYKVNRRRLFSK